ncbi:MAG: 50S ribosomal protein L32 [Deltaproteobacteria bacterium CG_4_10_14_0_2_um_filter_43_8]|nr:MAG: 50S ribosomal protein L32 [Deltaproteobacteria bacterium CG11_big_fil_rev_8_21_14_0_20_42_23]PJA22320.1 MAG: 50S ribosomal protein L32 [Deltaproteobacteria bacterium CG_4_10_14_0_2_um_filter_43_8]PJC64278.1 MAG: 50S ribosomal protein L32 [Deltaproteobacteria bacterium CG_4_9_14_0_2_um_filter_42_21]
MPVPQRRQSKSRTRMRRSHNMKYTGPALSVCDNCKRAKSSHHVCKHCGFYKGRQIIEVNV